MKKEVMFSKFMNEVGFYELGEKIWNDVCEDIDIEMLNGVTEEQFKDSDFMINYFIQNNVVDADRFVCYLEDDFEMFLEDNELVDLDVDENISYDGIEEVLLEMFSEVLINNNIKEIQGCLVD